MTDKKQVQVDLNQNPVPSVKMELREIKGPPMIIKSRNEKLELRIPIADLFKLLADDREEDIEDLIQTKAKRKKKLRKGEFDELIEDMVAEIRGLDRIMVRDLYLKETKDNQDIKQLNIKLATGGKA